MQIGKLSFSGYAALAPMAGVADRAMREICIEYGAAFTVSELISAKGISLGDKKSLELTRVFAAERPMAVQLFGYEPEVMADAASRILQFSPDFIDINMGCPAPKVANNGGGSSLMKDPVLAAKIVKEVVEAVDVPVTVKMRSGWDDKSINAIELAKRCEDAGAAAITVHGRTRAQMYAPPVNLDIIRDVKNAVGVPVIGNGDITNAKEAEAMYKKTGCDFVLIGRGSMGAPWVFSQINKHFEDGTVLPDPTTEERMNILLGQVNMMIEYKGERIAMNEARKHAAWYMKGQKGAAEFRRRCGSLESLSQLEELCNYVVYMNSQAE